MVLKAEQPDDVAKQIPDFTDDILSIIKFVGLILIKLTQQELI